MSNRNVIFVRRPDGLPGPEHLGIEDRPAAEPREGELLVQTLYLSVDPYMVLLMKGDSNYAPVPLGTPMRGRAVSRVLVSRAPDFAVGDIVLGFMDWAEHNVVKAVDMIRLDPHRVPLPAYLGAVGHSGFTAYLGVCDVAQARAGETVVVTAASGAVGSVAGQIARILGCRAVGIAGGPGKVKHVVEELGFDACIDYREPGWQDRLRAAAPDGVDVLFENVGGPILDGILPAMKRRGRIALCGMVSSYGSDEPVALRHFKVLMQKSLRLEGFSIYDHADRRAQVTDQLARWVADGRLKHRETITRGIENAAAAFVSMLAGDKVGKQLVEVAAP